MNIAERREMDFRLGAGPLAAAERLEGELDEELVGGDLALRVRPFRCASTCSGGDADVSIGGV